MAYDESQNQQSETGKGMDRAGVQQALAAMITDATKFADSELSLRRAQADKFYAGELFGDEKPNRSKVVLTILRDAVLRMMPSFMRVLFGAERPVEYVPTGPDSVLAAEVATRFIGDVVVQQDNRGFLEFYAWIKDALIKNTGVVKWWWDKEAKRARFCTLPPESHIYSPKSRTKADDPGAAGVAPLVGDRNEYTWSQLLDMGVSLEDLQMHGGKDTSLDNNAEEIARREQLADTVEPESLDPAMQTTLYIESYVYMDVDGDNKAELRKFCTVGPEHYVVNGDGLGEPAEDGRPYATLQPDPRPHTVEADGVADWTMDLQEIMSKVMRAVLDSLALSMISRYAFQEGEVNVDDLNNPALGSPIRVRQGSIPSQVLQEYTHTFVGREGLGVLEALKQIEEDRTGTARAVGISADSLQSTDKAAVAAVVTAAQERIELIARVFCETGISDLFRGLLALHAKYGDPRMMKFDGRYAEIDPTKFDPSMSIMVNVGLGGGLREQKSAVLQAAIGKQEAMLQLLGPTPMVDFKRYRDTVVKWLKTEGRQDADTMFGEIPEGWAPQPPGDKQPDPNAMIAQAEMIKAQSKVQNDQAKTQLDAQKAQVDLAREMKDLELREMEIRLTDQRERERIEGDMALRLREMNYKYQAQVTAAQIQADVQRERQQAEATAEDKRIEAESKRKPTSRTVKVQHDAVGKVSTLEVTNDGEESA